MGLELTTEEQARFKTLERICVHGRAVFYMVGAALDEIKTKKYYESAGYKTFGEYCESIGFTRRHGNQLIFEAGVIDGLPESLRSLVGSESAARALAQIPEKLRPAVMLEAQAIAGERPVAAADVRRVLRPGPRPENPTAVKPEAPVRKPKPEPGPQDGTGLELPKEIRPLWEEAFRKVQPLLTALSTIKGELEKAKEDGDIIFVEMKGAGLADAIAQCKQIHTSLETARPYAVCPKCNGVLTAKCPVCRERGYVSKFYWNRNVPKETKDLRRGT